MANYGLLLSARLPLATLVVAARRAEELGYAILWVPEESGKDAFTQLAALALNTSRIRLATGSVNCFSRTPYLMAMSAAALQEASADRFTLVMSPGEGSGIAANHGLAYQRPVTRLRDYALIVRRLLAGETVTYRGEAYTVPNARLGFRPDAPPPIFLAGAGPRLRRVAGEVADGALLSFASVDLMRAIAREVQDAAREVGRDPAAVQIACYVTAAADPRAEPTVRASLARTASMPAQNRLLSEAGLSAEAERIARAARSGDRAGAERAVTDRMLDALAVVGRAAWLRRAEAIQEAGIAFPSVAPILLGNLTPEGLLQAVETFRPKRPIHAGVS
ncbi:MAG: LLM class flavin-dependent oxidoreductase [Dehalococcoidia bacterium]|nr:LLM class flavin-dependent oxidoreductase [Dehalococcoidia bacterium]